MSPTASWATFVRFSELDGGTIGVWGAGIETRSFARHVADKLPGTRIAVVVLEEQVEAPELTDGANVVDARGAVEALRGCDVLVRSPGVSIHRPELRELAAGGVLAVTPTGLWLHEREGKAVLGITGTKGKSTTATLAAHLARAAGAAVQLAGNIGIPALDLLDAPADELVVLELSSYQIADLVIGPETAMVLNLSPEHIDWHGMLEAYEKEKLRLLALPGVSRCVLNATEPLVAAAATADGATIHEFGGADGWHLARGGIAHGPDLALATEDLPLLGPRNALNVCGALTALDAVGVEYPPLPAAFESYEPPPHRLQLVHDADGVLWVDDSISTTPVSAAAAVDSFPGHGIVLIGGGFDRSQHYGDLAGLIAEREAAVIGLPVTGARLVAAARAAGLPDDRAFEVADLPEAVEAARRLASPGTAVLLSPAAPSYNSYRNYIERGDHFARLAKEDN